MSLNASDRTVLFNSDSVLVQMQKFLINRPEHESSMGELRDMFSDISLGCFYSTISVLKARNVILVEGENIKVNPDKVKVRGTISDSVWRAIRILKRFTVKEIQTLLPNLKRQSICDAIKPLLSTGAIRKVATLETRESLYEIVLNTSIRPIERKSTTTRGQKADGVWEIVGSFRGKTFTTKAIRNHPDFKKLDISSDYADSLIRMWRGEGLIVVVGKELHKNGQPVILKVVGEKRCTVHTHYKEMK